MNFPACIPEFHFLKTPVTQQNKLILIIIHLIIIIISSNPTNSQSSSSSPTNEISKSTASGNKFQPSLVVVIGVITLMLSITFLLLIYAKLWQTPSSLQYLNQENFGGLGLTRSVIRVSGIDKTVIESLPVFRFSTLKGWRNGLECSICLSRFEDVEVLRLLPKCKHAFHVGCVDKWLESHSGCPLCRCEVSEEDVTRFEFSSSLGFLSKRSAHEGLDLELFVEREGSARFGSGRSVAKIEKEYDHEDVLHKSNHRIIISNIEHGLMGKNRWSSLSSSDLLVLKSEMITSMSSNFFHNDQDQTNVASMSSNKFDRYPVIKTCVNDNNHDHHKIKEEIKRKREFEKSSKLVEKRSMSEIIVHPRFLGVESSNKEGNVSEVSANEDRLKKLWLPIARRTIQMFANRDQQP